MAIGKASDFVLYDEQYQAGVWEGLNQNANVFNQASAGTIRLVTGDTKGHYERSTFFKNIANLVTRRDITATTAVTDLAMTQGESVGVKVARKIGPAAQTLDALRKIGSDDREASFVIGQLAGQEKAKEMTNTAIASVDAAIRNIGAAVLSDNSAATTGITHANLNAGLALFGDAAANIRALVFHSKAYFDLMKNAIADKVFEVAGFTIYNGSVATMGRPAIVVDAPALLVAGTPNTYATLGLVEGAVECKDSEADIMVAQMVTGLENLVVRFQGEYAYNLKVKGMAWDVANGGSNPSNAALATATNWDRVAFDNKLTAGVRILTQ
jgi:uncharacterized protein (DUF1810 family)